ncbi:MAG: DUF2634 domain-containing protein [Eubacteriales bacterium]|nr:DUF2634 domain-containing protein [Eubacteriales bacterium]
MDEDGILEISIGDEIEEEEPVYRTYRMDFENKRIIGMVDGLEASMQAAFKAMQTKRFAYLIYDSQYGCDVFNKIGNLDLSSAYLDNDIPAMIEDAFLNDETILGIEDLEYEIQGRDGVVIQFTISTIFGDAVVEGVIDDE